MLERTISDNKNNEGFQRKDWNVRISRPEGIYTIIYGDHSTPQPPSDLPEDMDCLFLEAGTDYTNLLRTFLKYKDNKQYKNLIPTIEGKDIPVFLPDISPNFLGQITLAIELLALPAATTLYGGKLLFDLVTDQEVGIISRRNFLKLSLGTICGWSNTSYISETLAYLLYRNKIRFDAIPEIQKSIYNIHPEHNILALQIRNAIIAQKESWLMQQMKNKPHFGTVLGALHLGIEDSIQQTSNERLNFLEKFKPFFENLINPESLFKLPRFDFKDGEWQLGEVFEVPDLKKLVI